MNEFSGKVDDDVIEELADELRDDDWAPRNVDDYADYLLAITDQEPYEAFSASVRDTRILARLAIPPRQQPHFYRLLYASVIIALETYLSDKFISSVFKHQARLRQFVESDRSFSKERVVLRDIVKRMDTIKNDIRKYLVDFGWHHLSVVSGMFLNTLNVVFPKDLAFLKEAIRVRHDIIHRNGKNKDDDRHEITRNNMEEIIGAASEVVWFIEHQLNPETVKPLDEDDEGLPF